MAARERRLAQKELQLQRERAASSGVPSPDCQHQLDLELIRCATCALLNSECCQVHWQQKSTLTCA